MNVKSIYLAGSIVIPRLIGQGQGGSVINISSTGASRPRPGLVWYNASKGAVTNVRSFNVSLSSCFFGMEMLIWVQMFQATKGLAAEYGPHNIRVNSVAPLLSGTGLFSSIFSMTAKHPQELQWKGSREAPRVLLSNSKMEVLEKQEGESSWLLMAMQHRNCLVQPLQKALPLVASRLVHAASTSGQLLSTSCPSHSPRGVSVASSISDTKSFPFR